MKFTRSIRDVLIGAPLASTTCVLVVLMLVGNLTTEQHRVAESMVTGTVRDAVAADQLQHSITSTHARVYRTLLWLSMNVDDIDTASVARQIQTELRELRAHRLKAMTATSAHGTRRQLLETIDRLLEQYARDVGELLEMAVVDPAMATLMMSRAEDNVVTLRKSVAELLDQSKQALTGEVPALLANQAEERSVGYQLIVLALLVSLVACIVATRSITVPLRDLTRAMSRARIGDGNAHLRTAIHRRDEIGAMSKAFFELEQARLAADTAVRKSHDELEGLVEARTGALAQANAELRLQMAERLTAETALRRSEQEHRNILDGSLQGVVMLRDNKVVYANDALAVMLGYGTTDELLQVSTALDLIEPEYHEVLQDRRAARLRGEVIPAQYEFKMRRQDQSSITVLNSARTVEWLGQQVTMCFVVDITAREQARIAAETTRDDAIAAARARSEFLANMSHEIRTPLNGVIGALALLQQTPLNGEQENLASVARVSGTALTELIDDILDFSKIDAGHLTLESIPLRPRDLVEDVIDMCAERAFSKNVDLYCVETKEVPTWVVGDPSRLRQVIANLVSNAIKFTQRGRVEVNLDRDGEYLIVAVKDTGVGMAPETVNHVFDAFVQEDSTTTRRFGGTGLGLTICHQIVNAMHGRIEVDSTPGVGTTFSVRIPAPTAAGSNGAEDLRGYRIALQCSHIGLLRDLASLVQDRWGATVVSQQETRQEGADCHIVVEPESTEPCVDTGRVDDAYPAAAIVIGRHGASALPTDVYTLRRPVRAQALLDALKTKLDLKDTIRFAERDDSPSQALTGLRVLVVDDVTVNRLIACKMLQALGAVPTSVENGAEAVAYLDAQVTDLVLMDCQMPVMDGYEATRRIRDLDGPRATVPVIALTAHALNGADETCLEAGMNDYMSKPLSPETLRQKLELWKPNGLADRCPARQDLHAVAV